jgi:LmbE family N-acetylglucosaminyl deacetylase
MKVDADARATIALLLDEQRRIDVYLGRQVVDRPRAARALMIGPHPDDNLFGAGGTALKLLAAGADVRWVCITDGRACVAPRAERERMVAVRAAEERDCAARLGVPEPTLYAIPEDRLTTPERTDEAVRRLREDLVRFAPDAVFAPYFLEIHPLHRYTAFLLARALADGGARCTVHSWGVGSFPPPSLVVDITSVFARKQELAACYASQLAGRDWKAELEMLGRLGASYALGTRSAGVEFAEAFFTQPWDAYVPDVLSRGLERKETLDAGIQPMVGEA